MSVRPDNNVSFSTQALQHHSKLTFIISPHLSGEPFDLTSVTHVFATRPLFGKFVFGAIPYCCQCRVCLEEIEIFGNDVEDNLEDNVALWDFPDSLSNLHLFGMSGEILIKEYLIT